MREFANRDIKKSSRSRPFPLIFQHSIKIFYRVGFWALLRRFNQAPVVLKNLAPTVTFNSGCGN